VGRSGRELLEEKVGYVWTVHLHNQWRKVFLPGGWMCRLLEGYKGQLEVMERYRQGERERGEVGGNGRVQVVEEVGVLTKRRLADEVEGEGEGSGDAEEVDNELVGDEEEVRGEGSEV